jgi:hypothetical protein
MNAFNPWLSSSVRLLSLLFLLFFLAGTRASPTSQAQKDRINQIAQENLARIAAANANHPAFSNITASLNKHSNTTQVAIARARAIVADAIKQGTVANKARFDNPQRNIYILKPSGAANARRDVPPSFMITPDIAAAAALVAEVDAAVEYKNGTLYRDYSHVEKLRRRHWLEEPLEKRQSGSYWMGSLDNLGTQPFGGNASYRVFRNVKDPKYGAKGDGISVCHRLNYFAAAARYLSSSASIAN